MSAPIRHPLTRAPWKTYFFQRALFHVPGSSRNELTGTRIVGGQDGELIPTADKPTSQPEPQLQMDQEMT
jgi:hypothetical protein